MVFAPAQELPQLDHRVQRRCVCRQNIKTRRKPLKKSVILIALQRIGLGTTLENRRVQDMLITINACFQGTAPTCIKELVKMRNNKYDLRGNNTLSLPKVNTTKYGLNSFRYFAAKQWNSIPNELRLRAGGLEFNKQVRNIQFQLSNFVILDARYFIFLHFYVHISFFLS